MPVASPAFRWTEKYSVHVAVLDQQHQDLFAAVDELNQALAAGEGNQALDAILQKLVDYTISHFVAEESLMEQHGFPGLATHRAQHQMFREKLAAFLEDRRAAKPGIAVALMFFTQNWLTQHVLHIDQQYSAYLNARGVH
jgi:hemerythrin-like metal-binding protein